jgi:Ca2+-binding RTX toxin-like protein
MSRWPGTSRPSRALLLAGLTAVALAAPARATTAGVRDGVLEIQGGPGGDLVQLLPVDIGGPALAVIDQYKSVDAGSGCVPGAGGWALCARGAIAAIDVDLGPGNDMLIADGDVPVVASGGEGDDAMTALGRPGQAPVTFDGGPGDDQLGGSPGADVLRGGPGADGIDGHGGSDTVDPGPGRDAVADSGGDDVIDARDAEPDFVDCGPGQDTGTFDAFDHAQNCELGQLPVPQLDCAPQVSVPAAVALARVRRTRVISLSATVPAGCTVTARLTDGRGTSLGRASAAAGPVLRIALSRRAVRSLRRGARLSLIVEGRAASTGPPKRRHLVMTIA